MRYYGRVGFVKQIETSPGVIKNEIVYQQYFGDVLSSYGYWQNKNINDDIRLQNRISILCDNYLKHNLGYAKVVEFDNQLWNIQSFSLEYPRVILTLGGLYNENGE